MAVRIRTTSRFRSAANQTIGSASLLVGNNIGVKLHRFDWFPGAGNFGAKQTDSSLGALGEVRAIAWDEAARNAVVAVGSSTTATGPNDHKVFRLTQAGLIPISTVTITGSANSVAIDPVEGVAVITSYASATGGSMFQYSQNGFGSLITNSNSGGATVAVAISPATKRVAYGKSTTPRVTLQPYSRDMGLAGPIVWTYQGSDSPLGEPGLYTVSAAAFNADGSRLIVGYSSLKRIGVYETDRMATDGLFLQEQTFTFDSTVLAVKLNLQETMLAVAGNTAVFVYRWDGAIISELRGVTPPGTVRSVDWSPDGKYLAVGLSSSPWVQVYRVDDTGISFACPNPTWAVENGAGIVNVVKFAY